MSSRGGGFERFEAMHRLSVNWKLIERQAFQGCVKDPYLDICTSVWVRGCRTRELGKVRGGIATGAAVVEVSKLKGALHLVDGPPGLSVDREPIE